MAWWDRFFADESARTLGGIEGIGNPVSYKEADDQATQGINIAPNTGVAHTKLALTKKNIPKTEDHENLIAFIKQVRAQFRVREQLQTVANQVTNGFRVKGTPEVKSWFETQNIFSKINRVAFELITIGWCVVYVTEPKDKQTLPQLNILHNVQIRRAVDGSTLVFLQLTDEAKDVIRENSQDYPSNWSQELDEEIGINITRVLDNNGRVTQGGAYFISLESDLEDIYPVPPLYPALAYAMDSEKILVSAGNMIDYIKFYLLQILVGNELGQDLRDGRVKPVSKDRVSNIIFQASAGYSGGAMVTPGDVELKHSVPERDPYDFHLKAVNSYSEMFREDVGLPDYKRISSEGVAAYIAKTFLPTLEHLRKGIIEPQLLKPLFLQLSDRVSGIETARVLWGVNHLFDTKTLLDRGKYHLATGGASIQYLNELIDPDYDFEAEMAQKEIEKGYAETVGMIWEPSQNLSDKAMELQGGESTSTAPADTSATEKAPKKTSKKKTPIPAEQKKQAPSPLDNGPGRPTN